ncbi:SDR family NAD(P)-dependent oxidoreductase [Pedobacter kyonggii]|uniref:SDR family NAD(P)-dependent oxidoreductase n=1 Tax=Pedobacter kyonggii TaxID=1926871 RepID=A0A4Q9HGT0_9SPHI|nr:SDR family NAD(P)-dependent oxidoreductase [Pedobacter kyonggii]TBO44448.1 SDR family NAD(P)-dependent oxidoreductase [Pedobacter kyonggii]
MEMINTRSVAITGSGSGLGRELALGFLKKGYRVFGTVLNPEELNAFENVPNRDRLLLSLTDITSAEQVAQWHGKVSDLLSGRGLDLLVNNAGVLTPGPMEALSIEAIRLEFDINVIGSIRVANTFLPLLRRAKGRIVQIGSMTGTFAIPFSGPSSASKAAMESFADVYREELRPFGVDFIMVQPGNMLTSGPAKTAAQLKHILDTLSPELRSLYGDRFERFSGKLNAMQAGGLPAAIAAGMIIGVAEQVPAPIRVPIGEDAQALLRMVKENPDQYIDGFRAKMLDID